MFDNSYVEKKANSHTCIAVYMTQSASQFSIACDHCDCNQAEVFCQIDGRALTL